MLKSRTKDGAIFNGVAKVRKTLYESHMCDRDSTGERGPKKKWLNEITHANMPNERTGVCVTRLRVHVSCHVFFCVLVFGAR